MWAVCVKSGGTGVLTKQPLGSDEAQCRTRVLGTLVLTHRSCRWHSR